MILKLLGKLKIRFSPPKNGDVYLADPIEFIVGRVIEKLMHGLRDKNGDAMWEVIPSDECYRLTIESDAMPTYYRCSSEVLCKSLRSDRIEWKKRSQPRRILKEEFHDMIVQGRLKKYEYI